MLLRSRVARFGHARTAANETSSETALSVLLHPFNFWLFDSALLYYAHYTSDGRLLGHEHVPDPRLVVEACQIRDAALRLSTPWRDYIDTRPQLVPFPPAA
jgi:hypothetical protein